RAEPWLVDASCCLAVEGAGRREVKSAAWWKIKAQVVSFVLFFAALGLAAWADGLRDNAGQRPAVASALIATGATAAVIAAVGMLGLIFGGDAIHQRILARRLGRRPGSMLEAGAGLPRRLLRIEDARTFHVQKLAPEDLGICLFDASNRRVLIEGVS